LGSNTCIQDAHNLAWKLALVLKGLASPSLLKTYSLERQPVGANVVKVANDSLRRHMRVWQALGTQPPGHCPEKRLAGVRELEQDSETAAARRSELGEGVRDVHHETHALGTEMGQFYCSDAVYSADEAAPIAPAGKEAQDPILYYEPSTYPGRRLPHAWLNIPIPSKPISTVDLVGKGRFCLLTGIGGHDWRMAAEEVAEGLGVSIRSVSIGWRQDWEDVYGDWRMKRGVEEDGAVLVRPDGFVGWRATGRLAGVEECREKLRVVMRGILGLEGRRADG
jgi:FAD binding domain